MCMKIIFKSLLKKKVQSILIIAQLTVTIVVLLSSFMMLNSTNYLQRKVKEKGMDLKRTIKLNIYNSTFSHEFQENYNELEKYVDTIPGISNFGAFDFTNLIFEELEKNKDYLDVRKSIIKGTFKEEFPTTSEMLMLDKGIYSLLNLKITDGNGLKQEDFYQDEQEETPVLAGAKYRNVLKINDVLTIKDTNCKYKIVGFIDENSSWLNEQNYISNMLINLDDKFILPYKNYQKTSIPDILSKASAIFYVVSSEDKVDYIKKIIDIKASSLNLRVESNSILNDLDKFKDNVNEVVYLNLFLAIFLIILSCLGISSVMISSVLSRKREFGIRMATGSSTSYIKKLIIGEIGFLAIVSSIIAISIVFINNLSKYKFKKYNDIAINPMQNLSIKYIVFVFLIILLIIAITTFVPLKKFKKLQAKDLIGGID